MKEIIVFLLSSFKFGMTFPVAILGFHFSFARTLIFTNAGGIAGIFLSGYLSERLIFVWKSWFSDPRGEKKGSSCGRKIFTARNRRIVRIKSRYGLPGIALATPILLSIPVGMFIVVRYFRGNEYRFAWMFAANFIWSLIYASFYFFWYDLYRTGGNFYFCLTIE